MLSVFFLILAIWLRMVVSYYGLIEVSMFINNVGYFFTFLLATHVFLCGVSPQLLCPFLISPLFLIIDVWGILTHLGLEFFSQIYTLLMCISNVYSVCILPTHIFINFIQRTQFFCILIRVFFIYFYGSCFSILSKRSVILRVYKYFLLIFPPYKCNNFSFYSWVSNPI